MAECVSCGVEVHYLDKFCSKCGAFTNVGPPIAEQLGKAVGDAGRELGKLAEQVNAYVRDEANRKQVIGGSALALLLVVLTDNPISNGVAGLFADEPAAPKFAADGSPDFANYQDIFLSEETWFIVTGTANIRSFPTSEGAVIIGTLQEGDTISAQEVQAFDPDSRWYKIMDGGYVWGGNLER